MKVTAHVYLKNINGKPYDIKYDNVTSIKAGTAGQFYSKSDCYGNGIRPSAPVIVLCFDNGEEATFDADNATILF